MSSEAIVSLSGVSKCYQAYGKPVHRLLQAFYKRKKKLYKEFWAVRNISLDIQRGHTVGIIGRNGSGKSTLLQIIAGTLSPTAGDVAINGRVSAILELGAGFNPEFTGRENARLNASIVGLTNDEIKKRMPEIIEFSGLEEFIDRPVKTYSSGMYVRLAFSVSININPDILIIDEALAVGDIKFQRKCFRKLEEMRADGVSIILVTHATDAILAHCDRAVLLEHGEIKEQGEPKDVVNRYLEMLFVEDAGERVATVVNNGLGPLKGELNINPEIDASVRRINYNTAEYRWGNGLARVIDFRILDRDGQEVVHQCDSGSEVTIQAVVHFFKPTTNVIYGLTIKTVNGVSVFGSNSEKVLRKLIKNCDGTVLLEFRLALNLTGGEYFFSIGVVERDENRTDTVLDRRYDLFHLRIEDREGNLGIANLPFSIDIHEKEFSTV